MRRLLLILAIVTVGAFTIASCTASKASSRIGCKTTQNMVGYR